jgi:hypothetical protein
MTIEEIQTMEKQMAAEPPPTLGMDGQPLEQPQG